MRKTRRSPTPAILATAQPEGRLMVRVPTGAEAVPIPATRRVISTATTAKPMMIRIPITMTTALRVARLPSSLSAMVKKGERVELGADEAAAGQRLDRWLAASLAAVSRSRIKALIETGHLSLAGATITDPSLRVKPGQVFELILPEPELPAPAPEAMPLTILYEDADLVVLDKPAGMAVHPAPGNPTGTLVNALIAHCGDSLSGIGGVKRPGIVHRLNKDTTRIMVVAKNDIAHQHLARQFAERRV